MSQVILEQPAARPAMGRQEALDAYQALDDRIVGLSKAKGKLSWQMGEALLQMKSQGHYLMVHGSWEAYLDSRDSHFSASHAHALMLVVETLWDYVAEGDVPADRIASISINKLARVASEIKREETAAREAGQIRLNRERLMSWIDLADNTRRQDLPAAIASMLGRIRGPNETQEEQAGKLSAAAQRAARAAREGKPAEIKKHAAKARQLADELAAGTGAGTDETPRMMILLPADAVLRSRWVELAEAENAIVLKLNSGDRAGAYRLMMEDDGPFTAALSALEGLLNVEGE